MNGLIGIPAFYTSRGYFCETSGRLPETRALSQKLRRAGLDMRQASLDILHETWLTLDHFKNILDGLQDKVRDF